MHINTADYGAQYPERRDPAHHAFDLDIPVGGGEVRDDAERLFGICVGTGDAATSGYAGQQPDQPAVPAFPHRAAGEQPGLGWIDL
jgi:hypothetical protein